MRLAWLLVVVGCGSGPFDRDRFDAVVAKVRPLVVQPGERYLFKVDDRLDPASLGPGPAVLGRGDGRGLVRAAIDARHHLAVSIETRDEGHAGEYGFMYVDDGFDPRELEGVQRDSQHEKRVADRWVAWTYDMD